MAHFLTIFVYDHLGFLAEETRYYFNGARPLTIVFHDGNEERERRAYAGEASQELEAVSQAA